MARRRESSDCSRLPRRSKRERHMTYLNLHEDYMFGDDGSQLYNSLVSKSNRYAGEINSFGTTESLSLGRRTLRSSNRISPTTNSNNSQNGFETDSMENEDENSRSMVIGKRRSEEKDMYERIKYRRQNGLLDRSVKYSPEPKQYNDDKEHISKKNEAESETSSNNTIEQDEMETKHYSLRPRYPARASNNLRENVSAKNDLKSFSSRSSRRLIMELVDMFGSPSSSNLNKQTNIDEITYSNFCSDVDPVSIDPSINFDKIGGLDENLIALKEMILIPLCYPELFAEHDVTAPKGVLFYGPPGTGKTLVARALANHCKQGGQRISFFMRKGADCLSKWVGDSERQLKLLFRQAYEMRPSIIFFDEIDGLAPARNLKQEQIHSSIVSTLLALMDGIDNRGEVIIIGATNRLDAIDPALRRPGRFDKEMAFKLPDMNGRTSILKIHTSSWNRNIPSDEDIEFLASKTSGFCGADLKALCTEAFFVALRSLYPQIYFTTNKLAVDPSQLVIDRNDFEVALRSIVPASKRDFTIPSRQLSDRMKILMGSFVDTVLKKIPSGYQGKSESKCLTGDALNFSTVREITMASMAPSARVLICGSSSEFGQTSYILPAIVNILDHLAIFSLSIATIFSSGQPEECFSNTIQAATRSISRGSPALFIIPSIDVWQKTVPFAIWNLLIAALDSFSGLSSVLLLATAECDYECLDHQIQLIFNKHQIIEIGWPSEACISEFFSHVLDEILVPPRRQLTSDELPKLEVVSQTFPITYTPREVNDLKKEYFRLRNETIFHYEQRISELIRSKRFCLFVDPVDREEVPDYYDFITNPMDLKKILNKAPLYKTPEECIADFRLILNNAEKYNNEESEEGRNIILLARELYRRGTRLAFEIENDHLEQIESYAERLREMGMDPDELEKSLLVIGNEFVSELIKISAEEKCNAENENVIFGRKKRKNHKKRVKGLKHVSSESHPEETYISSCCDDEKITNGCVLKKGAENKPEETVERIVAPKEKDPELQTVNINKEHINEVHAMLMKKCKGWPARKLEQISLAVSGQISKYKRSFDRSALPYELLDFIKRWHL